MRTQVAIIGAGPAGLLLSHLLYLEGIDSVIVEARDRSTIEETIRAGVLEQATVDLLTAIGAGERMKREGFVHHGFSLRFEGASHRIDLSDLTGGRAITVYAQHEVLKDLIALRLATGAQILFEHRVTAIDGLTSDRPQLRIEGPDGVGTTIDCTLVAGCDGGHGITRQAIPEAARREHARVYPFGWFGILAEAPPASHELVYARHERGFALISTRTPTVQRMYFQCDPGEDVARWSDARIWEELQTRVAGHDGFRLHEGPIFQKGVIPLRSFVCEPMRYGRLFLAGDAAHIVPPTGAKGLNLAAADVHVLVRAMAAYFKRGDDGPLGAYSQTALKRVWRAQWFSWWMTSMLHRFEDASAFDRRRQLAELENVTTSRAAATMLAETYAGMPFE